MARRIPQSSEEFTWGVERNKLMRSDHKLEIRVRN